MRKVDDREKKEKTRLISIVSKPILIVVVVDDIDVVFVKIMLGPKEIWLKKIHVQNNFGQRILGQKELGPEKLWSKKLRFKKIWGPKIFGDKNFLLLKIWDLTLKFGQN